VNSIEKINSITVAVQTEKNEERRITLDESASELFEKIQDTILSVRSSNKFSRFYSSIRFFYGPELKKY
jgi:hypothetical protein